jgi:hypothetical protein
MEVLRSDTPFEKYQSDLTPKWETLSARRLSAADFLVGF